MLKSKKVFTLLFLLLTTDVVAGYYIESENCRLYLPSLFFEETHVEQRQSLMLKGYQLAQSNHVLPNTLGLDTAYNRIFIKFYQSGCKECSGVCAYFLIWEGMFSNLPICRAIGKQHFSHQPSLKEDDKITPIENE